MKRSNMILTVALAALLPATGLFADPRPCSQPPPSCDKKLEATIINLEKFSWEIGRTQNLPAARKFYSDFLFEILNDGTEILKDDLIGGVVGDYSITALEFSDFHVVRVSETVVMVRYRIVCEFLLPAVPEISGDYELRAASTYALIRGCWKIRTYQESLMDFTPVSP